MRAMSVRPSGATRPSDGRARGEGPDRHRSEPVATAGVGAEIEDRVAPVAARPRAATWLTIPGGMAAGAVWGAVARAWMRWVSTDPEFSWAGTLMIISAFTIFGTAGGVAAALRLRRSRRWKLTVGRVVGVVGTMPLFVGAGAVLLPTVVAGGLAVWRRDWRRWLRAIAALVGCLPVFGVAASVVGDFGVVGGAARAGGLVALYGVVVAVTWASFAPHTDGWRAPRSLRVLGVVGAVVLLGVVSVGTVGIR